MQKFHPLISKVGDRLVQIWQEHLDLEPYPMPADLGYVEGKLEGERLTIQNLCYQTREFRKLHLELAQVGTNLDILHCVMYPRPNYPLPIFGTDLIGGKAGISAAIADLSPTVAFPSSIIAALQPAHFSQPRELPAWGQKIFSEFCVFVRPQDTAEEELFLLTVEKFCVELCQLAKTTMPEDNPEILTRQRYYCQQQQQNDKTRRILEKAFGQAWAERYMATVLFDVV